MIVYAFFLLSACRRGSHTPIPSGTRRASHLTFYSYLATLSCKTRATFTFAFHPWAFSYFRIVFFNLAFARALDIYATFTFLFMRYLYIYLRPQVGLAAEGVLGIRAEKKGGMKESHHTIRSLRRHN